MGTRRAALEGLTRILEAGALEDLFTGPDDDAAFMYDLLVEVARGRSSSCYWEICRTARRRGVTPEYIIDRAAVLLASIEERRRIDAYRILGVEGLASPEAIRHRWLEFAKTGHPDVGGDPARFRRVKDAYELLRDPQRRSEYERYWLRALGPFERVIPRDPELDAPVRREPAPERRLAMVGKRGALLEGPGAVSAPVGSRPGAP
ncbi:MAG TPA: DnaJ domain-containing protein, partial [Candidatus Limnocylindria bacterium]|nr:DnaJ domain-containing protein [Candidatus Limnocylindria bacterium]